MSDTNKYLAALFAKSAAWFGSAPTTPDHLLRHPARENTNKKKTGGAKEPKRRLIRQEVRESLKKTVECLLGYDNREHGCIGTPQANKLVLGIGTNKIHENTKVHVRSIQRRRKYLREEIGWIEIKEPAKRDPKGKFTFIPAQEKFTDKAYETIGFERNPSVYFQQQKEKNRKRAEKLKPLVKSYADEAFKYLQKKFGDALNKNSKVTQALSMQLNFEKHMTMDALCTFIESMLPTGPPPDPIPA